MSDSIQSRRALLEHQELAPSPGCREILTTPASMTHFLLPVQSAVVARSPFGTFEALHFHATAVCSPPPSNTRDSALKNCCDSTGSSQTWLLPISEVCLSLKTRGMVCQDRRGTARRKKQVRRAPLPHSQTLNQPAARVQKMPP